MKNQTDTPQFVITADTNTGIARSQNEDHFYVPPQAILPLPDGITAYLAIVADGVGGSTGGEVASQLAVQTIMATLFQPPTTKIHDLLEIAIQRANAAIYQRAQQAVELTEMSTTVVAAVILADQLYVAHVGDSRAYLIRNSQAHLLTQDHSWLQEALLRNEISIEEVENYAEHRSEITRWLGMPDTVEVDHTMLATDLVTTHGTLPLHPGDTILLCSDGLFDVVTDEFIAVTINKYATRPRHAVAQLIHQANANGGPDNITVVLMHWPLKRRRWPFAVMVAGLLFTLAGFGLLGLRGSTNLPSPTRVTFPPTKAVAMVASTDTAISPIRLTPTNTFAPAKVPTSTPVPVATATSSPTPTATHTPLPITNTNSILSITTTVQITQTNTNILTATDPFTASAAITATIPTTYPLQISLGEPNNASTLKLESDNRIFTFSWTTNYTLQTGEKFQLVFWQEGEDPAGDAALGVAELNQVDNFQINLGRLDEDLDKEFDPGSFYWGIRIKRETNSGSEYQFLGEKKQFVFTR